MPRVCRDDAVGHTEKTLGDDFRDLKGIEVLPLRLCYNSLQSILDFLRFERTKEHHLYFGRHEKEVSSRGMDLAIKRETI
jgi:hypothetical protein